MRKFDVCIIGGGAAGLAAAASLDKALRVCILEKNEIPGRKILATGGGRCNITNAACKGRVATLDFFAYIGLETYCDEEGRYYPYTNRASDVVKVLTDAISPETVVECGVEVENVKLFESTGKGDRCFVISGRRLGKTTVKGSANESVELMADRVILATGGKSAPQFGTTGDGYRLARNLGHTVTRVFPILTGVECSGMEFRKVKGIRARGAVTLLRDGKPIQGLKPQSGEIQFTDKGLSGICIFNLTPYITAEDGEDFRKAISRYEISMDLAPDFPLEKLQARQSAFGILTAELAEQADKAAARSSAGGVEIIRDWRVQITGVKGWRDAQCTSGGVNISEVNMETQESLIVPGLYLTGELLDIQGPCGGFNLQNAWETGIRAAADISEKIGRNQ